MPETINRRTVLGAAIGSLAALSLPDVTLAREKPQANFIRLNANENPYGPSERALRAAQAAVAKSAYYPSQIGASLREAIAERHSLGAKNIVLSTGSNEALCAAMAAWGQEGHILAPELTYSAHLNYARRIGNRVVTQPLNADMSIDLDAMAAAVNQDTKLVYVCNPNNPTGLTIDGDKLRDFCRRVGKHVTVLVDEAYNELTEKPAYTSMMDLVRAEENVVITRTFSKVYGLAGMRVGYAIGREDLVQKLGKHVMSWLNGVGLNAAYASFHDDKFLEFSVDKISAGRTIIEHTFKRHGITPLKSATNFVYADIGRNATTFAEAMRERGVLIRSIYAPYTNWSRVSTGRLEDLRAFSKVFDEVYGG